MSTQPNLGEERPEIKIGEDYVFYSTAHEARSNENVPLYLYSGYVVRVVDSIDLEGDDELEPMFYVEFEDDHFTALQGELDNYYRDSRQFYRTTGEWAGNTEETIG